MAVTDTTVPCHGPLSPSPDVALDRPVFERTSPFDGHLVARVVCGTREDTLAAVAVARRGFDAGDWSRSAGTDRAKVLLKWAELTSSHANELARIETDEVGKPISISRVEVEETLKLFERAAYTASDLRGEMHDDLGGGLLGLVRREPVGVVGAILPWNLPAYLFVQKVAFALAAGCSVVAKPSELTSGSALLLSRLAYEAGIPRSALQVITGYGSDAGQALAESPEVDLLAFTGSTATANVLATVKRPFPQRQHFELGGKGSTVVFADADLDHAVDGALFGFTVNQGESCTATTRLLVEDSIADEFMGRLGAAADSLRLGDPVDEATQLGPMISGQHHDRVMSYIDGARGGGAEVRSSPLPDGIPQDNFVAPTIIDGLDVRDAAFQQEIFGPVLAAKRFHGIEEALSLANSTIYGLADSVWTSNMTTGIRLARAIKTGTVWINTVHEHPTSLPFGGTRASGFGREKAAVGVEEYTQLKTITIQVGDREKIFAEVAP